MKNLIDDVFSHFMDMMFSIPPNIQGSDFISYFLFNTPDEEVKDKALEVIISPKDEMDCIAIKLTKLAISKNFKNILFVSKTRKKFEVLHIQDSGKIISKTAPILTRNEIQYVDEGYSSVAEVEIEKTNFFPWETKDQKNRIDMIIRSCYENYNEM